MSTSIFFGRFFDQFDFFLMVDFWFKSIIKIRMIRTTSTSCASKSTSRFPVLHRWCMSPFSRLFCAPCNFKSIKSLISENTPAVWLLSLFWSTQVVSDICEWIICAPFPVRTPFVAHLSGFFHHCTLHCVVVLTAHSVMPVQSLRVFSSIGAPSQLSVRLCYTSSSIYVHCV